MTLYNHKGSEIADRSTIYFDKTAVELHSSINLFVISSVQLDSLSVRTEETNEINLYEIVGSEVQQTEELNLSNVQQYTDNAKFIYKLNIKFSPTSDRTIYNKLNIQYSSGTATVNRTINLIGVAEDQKDNLIVLLANFKRFITDDYYTAFYDTDASEHKKDVKFLNRKRKEFIVQLQEITGYSNSYRSLLAAIDYFGYNELLSIREMWKAVSEETKPEYKSTTVLNKVLTKIDNSLLGYKKTNQLQLVYQINTEDTEQPTHDSDGFPYYINVLYDVDAVLIKLYAVKRILEQQFLPMHAKIVEITGEYQSTVAQEVTVWQSLAEVVDIDLTRNTRSEAKFEYDSYEVKIQRHHIDTDAWSIDFDLFDIPGYKNGISTALFSKKYFKIEEEYIRDSDVEVDMSRFYSSDFGIIKLLMDVDKQEYNRYQVALYKGDENEEVYVSEILDIADMQETMLIGVRDTGLFKAVVYLYDNYGGSVTISQDTKVSVINQPSDFKIYRVAEAAADKVKNLELFSSFLTNSTDAYPKTYPSVEPIDWETLSVNTFDPLNSTYTAVSNMEVDYDIISTYTRIQQLSGIQIQKLHTTAIQSYGYKYGTLLLDIFGDGTETERSFCLKNFEGHEDIWITANFDAAEPEKTIQTLITEAITAEDFYSNFTYSLEYFNDADDTDIPSKPMLRIIAKDISRTADSFYIKTNNVEVFSSEDVEVYFPMSSYSMLYYNGSTASDDIKIVINGTEHTEEAVEFLSIQEVVDYLEDFFESVEVRAVVAVVENKAISIAASVDIDISHIAIGKNSQMRRGLLAADLLNVQYGENLRLAEPIYAFIDTDTKLRNSDIRWTMTNSLTSEIVAVQKSAVFRAVVLKPGSYDIILESNDEYGNNVKRRNGCILIE